MRIIKITAGMTQEFEIIKTDAPDSVIEEQLKLDCEKEDNLEEIIPYDLLERSGYVVELIGCQDDDLCDLEVDKEFDWYDYYK